MAKILLLTPQLPYPPQQGSSLRNYHIIRGLAQAHELTLLSFVEDNQSTDPATIAPLLTLCVAVELVPVPRRGLARRLWPMMTSRLPDMAHRLHSPAFVARLRQLLQGNSFDIVQIEGLELAQMMAEVRVASKGSKIVFDSHNAETELQRRNMLTDLANPRRWLAAAYSWVQVGRLRRFEAWACGLADGVTAVSETDKTHLQAVVKSEAFWPRRARIKTNSFAVSVIPNSIDIESYGSLVPLPELPSYDLLFSGKMDYRPNVDAVLWFADAVWPLIVGQRPLTTWAIVGQKPHPRLERLRHVAGITLTGWVESVPPYLAKAQVVIAPFRIGSGTRLKLIEAMAAGKAIVSTRVGAEGFPVTHDRELWLVDGAEEMATAVLHLLDDSASRERLGTAARHFAAQYDWRQVVPRFNDLYAQL